MKSTSRIGEESVGTNFGDSERASLLLRVNNAVVSSLGLDELVDSISASLHEVIDHDFAILYLHDPATNELRAHALETERHAKLFEEGFVLPVEGSPSGLAFSTRQTIVTNLEDLDRYKSAVTKLVQEEGVKTACSVPLVVGDRVLGVMTLLNSEPHAYSEADAELLTQVAGQIALAVDNTLSYERSLAEKRRFEIALEASDALSAVPDLGSVLKITSAILRKHIPHDFAGIGLYLPDNDHFRIIALNNPPDSFQDEGDVFPAEGTPDGLAFKTREVVRRDRLDSTEFTSPFVKLAYEGGIRSVCIVPLISRDRAIGVLSVASTREGGFTASNGETLRLIANQIAAGVENAIQFDEIEQLKNKLASEKLYLEEEIQSEYNFEEIVGHSEALRHVLRQVETVAPTDSCVLLYGETGTGKELISRAIHNLSRRRDRTLVKLNCAAIPTGLLESELFGHEKGAFTGAVAPRVGRFELANRGTLLLDEIGDIPLELQPKLLRVLQESEFERLGSSRTIKTDVRMIAATNANLPELVEEKKFRSDLYYRLNVFPIKIPPLRERREDIPLLASYFTKKHARRMSKPIESIPRDAMAALSRYEFPGNVRELENFIERAVILTRGVELEMPLSELHHFQRAVTAGVKVSSLTLEDVERNHIAEVLKQTGGVIGGRDGAAEILNLPISTLRHRMKKLGLR